MNLLVLLLLSGGCTGAMPLPAELRDPVGSARQEETGVPIQPFSGLEFGFTRVQLPDDMGIDRSDGNWIGAGIVGGRVDNVEFMARLTWRQWTRLKVDEVGGAPPAEEIYAWVRSGMVELSAHVDFGGVQLGGTVGGGWFLIKHRYERELAPTLDVGAYVRVKPIEWLYVEASALGGAIRHDFNHEHNDTEFLYLLQASAGVQFYF